MASQASKSVTNGLTWHTAFHILAFAFIASISSMKCQCYAHCVPRTILPYHLWFYFFFPVT